MEVMRSMGLECPMLSVLEDMLDLAEEHPESNKSRNNPSRVYVRDAKAMAATPADVLEYPNAYVLVVDMPGIKAAEIKVEVESESKVVVVSGERKREKEEVRYLRMERRAGKFMRKFGLPDNVDLDAISAVSQDGVLRVTVNKLPPPERKRPKVVHVQGA